MWIRGLGLRRSQAAMPLAAEEIARLQAQMDTPWGEARFLGPAVAMSAARLGWDLPPAPLGSHPPSFG
jgi:hypothetical protein